MNDIEKINDELRNFKLFKIQRPTQGNKNLMK